MSNQRSDQNRNDPKSTELKIKDWEDIKLCLENQLTKLKEEKDGFEQMAAKLTSEVADLKLNLDELKSTKVCLEEKVSKLDVEIQQRDSLITELKDELSNMKKEIYRKQSNMKKEMEEIKLEKKSLFSELEDSKKSIEIFEPGFHVISTTNNGDSMIFFAPCFLEENKAKKFFDHLYSSINWYSKKIVINGEEKKQSRMVAWFGPYPYSYSGATLEPAEMPDSVLKIKQEVEAHLKNNNINATFNSVFLNLYRTNKDSVAWHSDDKLTMGICPTIASVSLGETRKFELRPKKKVMENASTFEKQKQFSVNLKNGSLIVMDGCMQDDWQHRIPKEYHEKEARINLTFRTVYPLEKSSHKFHGKKFKRKDVDTWNSHKKSSKISLDNGTFPSLINDISSASSGKNSDSHEASNSSLRSGEFNRFDEKETVENDDLNFAITYVDSSSETNDVKHHESINQSNSTFKTNSSKCHSENSAEFPSNVIKTCVENKELPSKKSLNVLAKAFIPTLAPASKVPNYNFRKYSLEELLHYDVKLMNDHVLMDFAYNFKMKVTERLSEFIRFDREELQFLCFLTDASETENNKKLIASRMIKIVSNNLERHQPPTNVRKYCYGKQNNTGKGKRSYQNQKKR